MQTVDEKNTMLPLTHVTRIRYKIDDLLSLLKYILEPKVPIVISGKYVRNVQCNRVKLNVSNSKFDLISNYDGDLNEMLPNQVLILLCLLIIQTLFYKVKQL